MTEDEKTAAIAAARKMGRIHGIKIHLSVDPILYVFSGESVWALADAETKRRYDADATAGRAKVTVDNDSTFYRELQAGVEVEIEFRGDRLPEIVIPATWIVS